MMFSQAELNGMRAAQESTLWEVCQIEPYLLDTDGEPFYGEPYTSKCGVRTVSAVSGFLHDGTLYSSLTSSVKLRLPRNTPLGMRDRVTIDGRRFEVAELPFKGVSGIEVTVSEVYS